MSADDLLIVTTLAAVLIGSVGLGAVGVMYAVGEGTADALVGPTGDRAVAVPAGRIGVALLLASLVILLGARLVVEYAVGGASPLGFGA